MHKFIYYEYEVKSDFWQSNVLNLACKHCTEPFTGQIFSYPVRYDSSLRTWSVKGIFCSMECKKRFILDNVYMNSSIISLDTLMNKIVYKVHFEIIPAPPQDCLKKFCIDPTKGLSLIEFRKYGKERKAVQIAIPPLLPFEFQKTVVCVEDLTIPTKSNEDYAILKYFGQKQSTSSTSTATVSMDVEKSHAPLSGFPSRKLTHLGSFFEADIEIADESSNDSQQDSDGDDGYVSPIDE